MARTLLLVVLLAPPAQAAPQLKPPKPRPGSEDARIEALRARFDEIRRAGFAEERRALHRAEAMAEATIGKLEELAKDPPSEEREAARAAARKFLDRDPLLKDLYDVAMYDRARKKAGGGK